VNVSLVFKEHSKSNTELTFKPGGLGIPEEGPW